MSARTAGGSHRRPFGQTRRHGTSCSGVGDAKHRTL
nr:MAG TPA: hypothetical protein [Caudoviricetes sp.]DAI94567.1 MAG TPA: hypothetical protein [Caudoviricetes sp.]